MINRKCRKKTYRIRKVTCEIGLRETKKGAIKIYKIKAVNKIKYLYK